ncbi:MAG: hypothetical protein JXA67_15695 [Micromonosporaceae bacterium]|nr:hypothetical protein [Micromonosporaceae bacterium]
MPSAEEVRIVKDAIRAESDKWSGLSTDLDAVKRTVDGLDLIPTAFYIGNPVTSLLASKKYNELQDMMINMYAEAVTEFSEISTALTKAIDLYEECDGKSVVDLTRIYGQ